MSTAPARPTEPDLRDALVSDEDMAKFVSALTGDIAGSREAGWSDERIASQIAHGLVMPMLTQVVEMAVAARDTALAERDEAREEALDARSTLDAWFDTKSRIEPDLTKAFADGLSGYLRTARCGGLDRKLSVTIQETVDRFLRLYGTSLLTPVIERAAATREAAATAALAEHKARIAVLEAERDEARAKIAEIQAELPESLRDIQVKHGVRHLRIGHDSVHERVGRWAQAIRLLLPFVDRAAGEGLEWLEDGDSPPMDPVDLCRAVAAVLHCELGDAGWMAVLKQGQKEIREFAANEGVSRHADT